MKRVLAFLKQHALPAALCFGVALALMQTPFFRHIENLTMDERVRLRARLEVTVPADEIALLAVDETSLREIGRWPWDREVHGDLMALLGRVRPSVVAWDFLFTEPSGSDAHFARGIRQNRAVVLGAMRPEAEDDGWTPEQARAAGAQLAPITRVEGDRRLIPAAPAMIAPQGELATAAAIGFVDTPVGADGVRRTAPLVVRIGAEVYPALALRTLMAHWGVAAGEVTVRLGREVEIESPLARRRIPIDATGAYAINFRSGPQGVRQYGYSTVLVTLAKRFAHGQAVPVPALAGRIVLVGQVADGLTDLGPTPFAPLTPLVLVHANVIENVLREDYLRVVPPGWIWAGAFGAGLVTLAAYGRRRPIVQGVVGGGVPLVFVAGATLAWINGSWVVPLVGPLLGYGALQGFMIARRMLQELHAKERIKGMFGTYVSPELVRQLVASGQQPELGGHEEEITAFFSDIQEFSSFSEILPPDRLVELMNEYLTLCTDIVQANGGTLDKYIGDAVVAMYGAPVRLPDHAYRACRSAVEIQRALAELRERWRAEARWPELVMRIRTRIGLNTGPCVIGNMGSRTRFNYTMMGDHVNLAARMESGAKSWGTYAMCTEATRRACEAAAGDEVVFRPLGRIRVKGRRAAVPIHEIVGRRGEVSEVTQACLGEFAAALERYYGQDWAGAEAGFRRSAALEPLATELERGVKTTPSLIYIELVSRHRLDPPPAEWDGVYEMKEK
ncbi:adenylate/guanylate cyclase domain-containing protein [Opitutus sp. ER46]|uniref:CHASE2 domain-containing protein n=1 Tax=Opitutus sp. ER46 TaxID=2161864 RepID=UPI000D2F68BC|nr:adenylate/guanylate cyclase domain-containing protein [Opitutus sp. ER46]PTX90848.1 hypothetical protein DB354_19540 [Opitutus sp. ER46]